MSFARIVVVMFGMGLAWAFWPQGAETPGSGAAPAVEVSDANLAATAGQPAEIDPEILARAARIGGAFDPAVLARASRLKRIVDANPYKMDPPAFCYDVDTDTESMEKVWELVPQLSPYQPRYQFSDNNRWGGAALQGEPTVLTWSLVPDGLMVDGSPSELFSAMDAKFGNRGLWIAKIQQCFDRWAALTGTSYVRVTAPGVDWDDGGTWLSAGAGPTRGEIRIASINIDGGSNILAYNYFPQIGDMVLDSSENWASLSGNDYRFFRNTVLHEHGHGLGFGHICPIYNLWLMEPFLNTGFDGPQHDDIRAGQRGYGDANEPNDNFMQATAIGPVIFGSPVTYGNVASPAVTNGTLLSIDGDLDEDWYHFTVIDDSTATVTVTPVGLSYDNSPQQCQGELASCCFFNFVDSLTVSNLNIELYDSDGITQIAAAANNSNGESETVSDVVLPSGPGNYYIRITKQDAGFTPQLYRLNITVVTVGADVSTPQPDPVGFEVSPTPISTTAISMTATDATDATAPIEFQFDFVSGGSGGGPDSLWQTARDFTDTGLLPNRNYTYRVRARDSAPPPGPNVGAYSASVVSTTFIETPAGLSFGSVTESSVVMSLIAPLPSFYTVDLSGILFDSVTPGGDDGLNEWVQVTTDTAINLTPNTLYEFRAKARNRLAVDRDEWSPSGFRATLAAVPGAPLLSNAASTSMEVDPDAGANPAHTEMWIRCVATSPFDANWDGQYVDAGGLPSVTPVWQSDAAWGGQTVSGMQPETEYTFVARARNLDGIETADGATASLSTLAVGLCDLLGDVDDSGVVDALDIAGFVRVKLGMPDGGDQVGCADYGNGDVMLDTDEFVTDLLGE
ncbi:MAG: hypothetical protein DCC65_14655 [Planctomycetota bacterium]|nr:MAG: hypothetical protein DCC65_14655 [Planctomycetota bacterium]